MPQCTSATFSRGERAGPGERHARPDSRRRQSTGRPAESARLPPRGASTTASAAPPSRSDQDAAAPDSGGAGPGLCPEWPRARCARIYRMTAGSCSVAISRRRPPQRAHANTSMPNARCIRPAQFQARRTGGLHPRTVQTCGQRRRRGRGLGRGPSIDDHSANTPRQISKFVSGRGVIAAQPFQELQRLEDQLSCPVVPRPLELQRDAAVAPQPQALWGSLLREEGDGDVERVGGQFRSRF
jgi:hypothetical protein